MNTLLKIVFVLLITLMPMTTVSAQADDVFCGTLTTSDCDILKANQVADAEVASMSYELQIMMSVLQDIAGAEPQSFTIHSAGALGYDKADLDAMTDEILNTTIGEVLELMDNPEAFVDRVVGYVERFLKAPTADLNVEVVLPEGVEADLQSITADFKMTEGVIYVASPLLEAANLPPDSWVSLDLIEGFHMLVALLQDPAFAEGMMGGMPAFPSPTTPEMGSEGPPAADAQAMFARIAAIANAPYWAEMDTPEFTAQIESITRLADMEMDGASVAVFEDRIDMAALVATAQFQQAFSDLFDLFAQDTAPEDLEALKPVILDMLSTMEIVSTQAIGLEDHFTYSVEFSWTLTVDPKAFVPEEDQANLSEGALAIQTQTFEFRQDIRDHNQPVEVTPPPEENVIPLLAMLMGGSPPQE